MPRINLVEKEQAHPAFREIYERQEERGFPVLNIVRLLAHCPEIGNNYQRFAGSILLGEKVPAKLRELATLRVGYLAQAEYWLHSRLSWSHNSEPECLLRTETVSKKTLATGSLSRLQ